MIRGLLDRIRGSDASTQYELQRMTPQGGWKNFFDEWNDGDKPATFDAPREPISFDETTGWPTGRYRCIKRVDGHIQEVIWTRESPDAEGMYARAREIERQQEQLAAMDVEELDSVDPFAEFDQLDRQAIEEAMQEKRREEDSDNADDKDGLSDFEEWLIREVVDQHPGDAGESAAVGLDHLQELHRTKSGGCVVCYDSNATKKCESCGKMVCRDHRDQRTGICAQCLDEQKAE